jgi:hypothetical protein
MSDDLMALLVQIDRRLGAIESAQKAQANEVLQLRSRISRAEIDAAEAKRVSDTGVAELRATETALIGHVDKATRALIDNDARQNRMLSAIEERSHEMIEAFRERRAVEAAKAEMSAQNAAREAAAIERAERRRRVITWALGALFVAAQTLQIATNLGRP